MTATLSTILLTKIEDETGADVYDDEDDEDDGDDEDDNEDSKQTIRKSLAA